MAPMISREDLPEDAADWTAVSVFLDRLDDEAAQACSQTPSEVMEYVRVESADLDQARQEALCFLRTARIQDSMFWIWS